MVTLTSPCKLVWSRRIALEAVNPGSNPGRETIFSGGDMKHEWYVKDGSVFSTEVKIKCSKDFRLGKNYKYQNAIAFNVGDKLARHIVELHNASLKN
jgi:hypothetical protein